MIFLILNQHNRSEYLPAARPIHCDHGGPEVILEEEGWEGRGRSRLRSGQGLAEALFIYGHGLREKLGSKEPSGRRPRKTIGVKQEAK